MFFIGIQDAKCGLVIYKKQKERWRNVVEEHEAVMFCSVCCGGDGAERRCSCDGAGI